MIVDINYFGAILLSMSTSTITDQSVDQSADQLAPQPAHQSGPSSIIHADRAPTRYQAPDPQLRHTLESSRTVTFTIDEDMILAAQDQARSMGMGFNEWCQTALNDSLRIYLGV